MLFCSEGPQAQEVYNEWELKGGMVSVGKKGNLLSIGQVFVKYDLMHSVWIAQTLLSLGFLLTIPETANAYLGLPERRGITFSLITTLPPHLVCFVFLQDKISV